MNLSRKSVSSYKKKHTVNEDTEW